MSNSFFKDTFYSIKKEAKLTRANITGKITNAYAGKRFDVTTADGRVYRKVSNANPALSFNIGDWVIMEFTTTDWQIIAFSASASGD